MSKVSQPAHIEGLTDARKMPQIRTLAGALRIFFTFPTPKIFLAQILALAIVRPFLGMPGWIELALVAGVAVYWPFQEWFLHNYVLHFRPIQLGAFTLDPYFGRVHRFHHRHPWALEPTFLPARVILPLIPLNLLVFWAITPTLGAACTGAMAMGAAALLYEWVHFVAHIPYRPTSPWLKTVVRRHHLHHFKNEHYWHGFTVPWVDDWMGTAPDPRQTETSPTVRTLGVDEEPVI